MAALVEISKREGPLRSSTCPSDCCSCASEERRLATDASDCIFHCGFVVVPSMWPTEVLTDLLEASSLWFSSPAAQENSYVGAGGVNRMRRQAVLPDAHPFNSSQVLYSEQATEIIGDFMRQKSHEPTVLHMASIVVSMSGSASQPWYQDGRYNGITVQVPLVPQVGPVELIPLRNNQTCTTVRADGALGSAVFYQPRVWHRGTANEGLVDRPALEFSFLSHATALRLGYLPGFQRHARLEMHNLARRYAKLAAREEVVAADLHGDWCGWDFLAHHRIDATTPQHTHPPPNGSERELRLLRVSAWNAQRAKNVTRVKARLRRCFSRHYTKDESSRHYTEDIPQDVSETFCAGENLAVKYVVDRHTESCAADCVEDYMTPDGRSDGGFTHCMELCSELEGDVRDHGPWPCGEPGCGILRQMEDWHSEPWLECAELAPVCHRQFNEIWRSPPGLGKLGERLVAERCPETCKPVRICAVSTAAGRADCWGVIDLTIPPNNGMLSYAASMAGEFIQFSDCWGYSEAECCIYCSGSPERNASFKVAEEETEEEFKGAVGLMRTNRHRALAEFRGLQLGLDPTNKHHVALLFNSAEMAFATGDLVGALDYYDRLLYSASSNWPSRNLALAHRGRTLGDLGRAEEAIASFDMALSKHLESPSGPTDLGFVQMVNDLRSRSAQAHVGVGSARPESVEAQLNAGIMAEQLGAYAQSINFLERALHLDASASSRLADSSLAFGGRFSALLWAGKANIHLERYEEAAHMLSSAITLRPWHAEAYRFLAYAECSPDAWRRRDACLEAYRATYAVRTTPESYEAATKVLLLLKQDERHAEAERFGREAVHRGVMLSVHQYSAESLYPGLDAPRPYRDDMLQSRAVRVLERSFDKVRAEVLQLFASGKLEREGITDTEGLTTKGNWVELNLIHQARRIEKNLALLPYTAALLLSLPEAHTMVFGASKVSVLAPGTSIKPHCGGSNTRMRIHLGLVVPEGASITVGGETRGWQEGKCLIFDDSIEHSVLHTGSQPRLVLIVDVWHPAMSHEDRARSIGLRHRPADGSNELLLRYLDTHQLAEERDRGAAVQL